MSLMKRMLESLKTTEKHSAQALHNHSAFDHTSENMVNYVYNSFRIRLLIGTCCVRHFFRRSRVKVVSG